MRVTIDRLARIARATAGYSKYRRELAAKPLVRPRTEHDRDVERLLEDMRNRPSATPITSDRRDFDRHCARPGAYKAGSHRLPIRALSSVLEIDPAEKTAVVEAGCSMERLARTTLPHGLLPAVVPEIRNVTAGGAVQGLAVESSSHYHGLFDNSALWYKVVLGDGRCITASAECHRDLFYGITGSFGSLGYITSMKLALVDAAPTMAVKYLLFGDRREACARLTEMLDAASAADFIEMIAYDAETHVIVVARPCGENGASGLRRTRFDRHWSPWFYVHALRMAKAGEGDVLSTEDYLFRYDRGIFWLAATKMSHHPLARFAWGWMADQQFQRFLRRSQRESEAEKNLVVQDIGVPLERLSEALEFSDRMAGIYPLWCLPVRCFPNQEKIFSPDNVTLPGSYIISLGIYGQPTKARHDPLGLNRAINDFVRELGTGKALSSVTYYDEDEFWSMFDRSPYRQLRTKYGAEGNLLDIWEKLSRVS